MTKQHPINLDKSPLSGSQITDTDMRRRRYAFKCERIALTASLLTEAALGLQLDLFAPVPTFEASGGSLICRWASDRSLNLSVCDQTIALIDQKYAVLAFDRKLQGLDRIARLNQLERISARIGVMKTEIVERSRYGNT